MEFSQGGKEKGGKKMFKRKSTGQCGIIKVTPYILFVNMWIISIGGQFVPIQPLTAKMFLDWTFVQSGLIEHVK